MASWSEVTVALGTGPPSAELSRSTEKQEGQLQRKGSNYQAVCTPLPHTPPPPPPASWQGILASFARRGQEERTRVYAIMPAFHSKRLTAKQGICRSKRGWGLCQEWMSQRAGRSHQTFQRTHRGSVWLPVHGVSMSQNRTERLSLSPIVNHGQLILSTSRRLTGTNEKIEDGFPSLCLPSPALPTN